MPKNDTKTAAETLQSNERPSTGEGPSLGGSLENGKPSTEGGDSARQADPVSAEYEWAKILKKIRKNYLWDLHWSKRFVCVLLGILTLAATGIPKILVGALEINFKIDEISSRLDSQFLNRLLILLSEGPEFLLGVYSMLFLAVAAVITWGIPHGGPLRLFILGVAIPGLVFYVANRASV